MFDAQRWGPVLTGVWLVALPACEITTEASDDGNETSESDPGDDGDGVDCTPNQSDGVTACSGEQCQAGNYCFADLTCMVGCESRLNCDEGQWCDLRMPTVDAEGVEVGVCRDISDPACGGDDAADGDSEAADDDDDDAGCDDVQGNYRLTVSGDSPNECSAFINGGQECSVAQEGCEITWGCGPELAVLLTPGPIDEDNVYRVEGEAMGIEYDCEIEFTPGFDAFFSWSCSFAVDGQALVCEGFG